MQEIAAALGISVTTVSHALSGKRPVNAETASRIHNLIEAVGYTPDAAAQRLSTGRSQIIGLAIPDLSHWYFARIAQGVEEYAGERDFGMVVCSTASSSPRAEGRYFSMLRTRAIDGLIYTSSVDMNPTDGLIHAASTSPLVLADEEVPTLVSAASVASDNLDGGRQIGRHLASLGHEKAVVLTGPPRLKSQVDRLAGVREHLSQTLIFNGDFELASGYELVGNLFAHGVNFTAIVCCNDLMAIGAIQRIRELGYRVPEDISVVGFDDIDTAALIAPALTTIRQNPAEIGRVAARLLLDRLSGTDADEPPTAIKIPVDLVVRETTARPRTT